MTSQSNSSRKQSSSGESHSSSQLRMAGTAATADGILLDLDLRNPVHDNDNFEGYRLEGFLCDFELRLQAGLPPIKAHQLVLSKNAFFKNYFLLHKSRKYFDCKSILKFPNPEMEKEILENTIKYIYTGVLSIPQLSGQKMKLLYKLAHILEIPEIKTECVRTAETYMRAPGQLLNWQKLLNYVFATGIQDLIAKFQEWLKDNLDDLISGANLEVYAKVQFLNLIKGTVRCLETDSVLLKTIFQWFSKDERKRSKDLRSLVDRLDLKLIYRNNPELFLNSPLENVPECHKLLLSLFKESAEELLRMKKTLGVQVPKVIAEAPAESTSTAALGTNGLASMSAAQVQTNKQSGNIGVGVSAITAAVSASTTGAPVPVVNPEPFPGPSRPNTSVPNVNQVPGPSRTKTSVPALNPEPLPGPSRPRTDLPLPLLNRRSQHQSTSPMLESKKGDPNQSEKRGMRSTTTSTEGKNKKLKVSTPKEAISIHDHLKGIKPEAKSPVMKLLYIFKDNGVAYFEVYDFLANATNILHSTNEPRDSSNLLFRDGAVYYIGGGTRGGPSGEEASQEVQVFNPEQPQGKQMVPLYNPTKAAASCFFDDSIYVIGGESANEVHSCVQMLPLRHEDDQEQFQEMTFLNHPRGCHSVFVLDEKIYVVGGFGKYRKTEEYAHPLRTMECYSPKMDCWEYLIQSNLNEPRGYCSVAKLGDIVYCLGGVSSEWVDKPKPDGILKSVEMYNTETRKWTLIADMNEKRFAACAFACNGLVYVFGGNRGKSPTAEFYDPETGIWKYLAWPSNLPHPKKDDLSFFYSILLPSD